MPDTPTVRTAPSRVAHRPLPDRARQRFERMAEHDRLHTLGVPTMAGHCSARLWARIDRVIDRPTPPPTPPAAAAAVAPLHTLTLVG